MPHHKENASLSAGFVGASPPVVFSPAKFPGGGVPPDSEIAL